MQYQGRPAQRRDSQLRRHAILQATLDIIAEQGVREVRHRAVASRAGVPLSATTYYFSDINALLHDALLYFLESGMATIEQIQQQALTLSSLPRTEQIDALSQLLADYVAQQVNDRANRHIEWAFRECALRDNNLAHAQVTVQRTMLNAISAYFRLNDKSHQQADLLANAVLGTLLQLEYQALLGMPDDNVLILRSLLDHLL